jgi:hypothetical protein
VCKIVVTDDLEKIRKNFRTLSYDVMPIFEWRDYTRTKRIESSVSIASPQPKTTNQNF